MNGYWKSQTITEQYKRNYGHVMRKPSCLEKDISDGCISGGRSRGRQRRRWTEDSGEAY